jgi:hypothetical protein
MKQVNVATIKRHLKVKCSSQNNKLKSFSEIQVMRKRLLMQEKGKIQFYDKKVIDLLPPVQSSDVQLRHLALGRFQMFLGTPSPLNVRLIIV